jgi:hypothetical protein
MKLTGQIDDVTVSLTGKPKLTLVINEKSDLLCGYDDMKDIEKLSIEIKQYREKRSLNANAYAWKLIGEIADIARASKEEIYLEMLRRYGQSELISVLAHIPIQHYVKYYDEAGESKLNGKLFKHYRVYKGSSEFDTREMSVLIDGIVGEAKELGIQTETPEQLAKIKSLWKD